MHYYGAANVIYGRSGAAGIALAVSEEEQPTLGQVAFACFYSCVRSWHCRVRLAAAIMSRHVRVLSFGVQVLKVGDGRLTSMGELQPLPIGIGDWHVALASRMLFSCI